MVFQSLKRPGIWASLVAAFAFCLPTTGAATAATHGSPTPLTITPQFAASTGANAAGPTASADGVIEVAQARRGRVRRLRRGARRGRAVRARNRARVRRGYRRGYRRGGRRYARRHYRPRRYYRRGHSSSAVVGGIIGFTAGAIAAGALYDPAPRVIYRGVPAPYTGEWYRRCSRKYRSFRASDGTFLGYDGIRRRCRLP